MNSHPVQMAAARFPPLPTVRDLIKLYKLRAMKQLSQNFLLDSRVCHKIVKSAGRLKGVEVCEVGPGPGSITRAILERNPSKLVLVEKDSRFLPILEMLAEQSRYPVKIIRGDILNFNMENMFSEDKMRPWVDKSPDIHLIGNLPFNISTPLIIKWLHSIAERRSAWRYGRVKMTLTFQKEVAERIVSPILRKSRCRLSVMCQNWCYVEHKLTINGSAFVPPPDVDVGVVTFEPMIKPVIDLPFKLVEKVVRSLFHSRQKYCRRGVEVLFPPPRRNEMVDLAFKVSDIDPMSRPVMLTVGEIGRIVYAYSQIISKNPQIANYEYRSSKIYEEDMDDLDVEEIASGEPLSASRQQ